MCVKNRNKYIYLSSTEFDCTMQCTKEDQCFAVHFIKETKVCEMGKIIYRIDLEKGAGIRVRVAKDHLPEKGTFLLLKVTA